MERSDFLTYILLATAFILLFFSPFGPISDIFIPYHPVGWAGIAVYFAMLLSFNRKYENRKDNFWFLVAAGFFPLFISDLYFFPIPRLFGLGMLEWAGVQLFVFPLGFCFYSKERILKFGNLAILLLFPLMMAAFMLEHIPALNLFKAVALATLTVTAVSLSYYAYKQTNNLFIIGTVTNFMIAGMVVVFYEVSGIIPFGWSHLFMAVVTDRIAIFGRILMALSGIIRPK